MSSFRICYYLLLYRFIDVARRARLLSVSYYRCELLQELNFWKYKINYKYVLQLRGLLLPLPTPIYNPHASGSRRQFHPSTDGDSFLSYGCDSVQLHLNISCVAKKESSVTSIHNICRHLSDSHLLTTFIRKLDSKLVPFPKLIRNTACVFDVHSIRRSG